MKFIPTSLPGVLVIRLQPFEDERGSFARTFCATTFKATGLNPQLHQINLSTNHLKGTLRGLHYQDAPFQEAKVVQCLKGSLFDVAVDLRPDSPTFKRFFGLELSAANRLGLYIPEGCAHGFQTLEDNTDVLYLMSQDYVPEASKGYRFDDPAFGIAWPDVQGATLSEKDKTLPLYHLLS